MSDAEKYAVVLTDYDGDASATVFEDKAIWDWLNAPTTFPSGVSSVDVPLPPGYRLEDGETTANITVGSSDNDRWLFAGSFENADGTKAVRNLDVYSHVKVAKELIRLGIKDENIIEGLAY